MLTLIKGQSGKLNHMSILHNGTIRGIMISYGMRIFPMLFEERECWNINPRDTEASFEEYLEMILKNISKDSKYDKLYLYANFTLEEAKILENVIIETQVPLDVYVTVRDNSIPKGQILIEEVNVFKP